MSAESSGSLPSVPHRENIGGFHLRQGQAELVEWLKNNVPPRTQSLVVQWPTGYGKSIGIALVYKYLRTLNITDRLLVITSNDTQREQLLRDFKADCATIGLSIRHPWRFRREAVTTRMHLEDKADVFVANIQTVSSTNRSEIDTMLNLLTSGGNWMLAGDEFHHLMSGRDWGTSIKRLIDASVFAMATSATPHRARGETIFGKPDLTVRYQDAWREGGAVKTMIRHKYNYLVETIDDATGEITTYETKDIAAAAQAEGGIDKFEERRSLRYTGKYIWPIITGPIARLNQTRLDWLSQIGRSSSPQMLVRAMSCRHAKMIAEQVGNMIGDAMTVDWVGTGLDGRTDDENKRVLAMFCPEKDAKTGLRPCPALDILVQVAMAGEGMDSVPVCEIIDLSMTRCIPPANQDKQMMGRGARWVPGLGRQFQVCHINVPTDHPLAEWPKTIDAWFDDEAPPPKPETTAPGDDDESNGYEPRPLPRELPRIKEVEFLGVTSDPHFSQWADEMNRRAAERERKPWDITDPDDAEEAARAYRAVLSAVTREQNERLNIDLQRSALDTAIGQLAFLALRKRTPSGRIEKSAIKDMKRQINIELKRTFGERSSLIPDEIEAAYQWCLDLEERLRSGRIPLWLM